MTEIEKELINLKMHQQMFLIDSHGHEDEDITILRVPSGYIYTFIFDECIKQIFVPSNAS